MKNYLRSPNLLWVLLEVLLPVCPDLGTGIFLVFSFFFFFESFSPALSLSISFLVFTSLSFSLLLFVFSPLFLSPSSFPTSYFLHPFSLLFPLALILISPLFSTFSHFCLHHGFQPAKKGYPHRLFSSLWSPSSLCKQASPAVPRAPVNPETPTRLRGTCLAAGATGELALLWKVKQRGSVCQSREIGKKTWFQPHAASFMFPQLKQPVGKVACHCSALVYWPLRVLVSAHHTQHFLSLIDRTICVCMAQSRFITAH